MAKSNTVNYDEIRVGNTLMVEARELASKQVKQFDEDDQQFHMQRLVDENYERLVKEHNATAVSQLPLSGVQVTAENKNIIVTRYTLKDGVSKDDAKAVLAEHETARTTMHENLNIQSDMKDADFDDILKKAFDIHDVTMEEASQNRVLKRFAADCLIDEPVVEAEIVKPVNLFEVPELPHISGEALIERLDVLGMDQADFAIKLEMTIEEIGPWFGESGVPAEHRQAVFDVISEKAVAAG